MKNIFSIDTFFSTESIPYEEGIIFRGNLRGDPDATYKLLSSKLRTHFDEKYCLFLVEGNEGKPVVIVLPNTNNHKAMTTLQKNLAIVLFLATVVTSLEKTSILLGFDLFDNWNRFHEVIPITLALWIIIAFHEIGHLLVASFYNIKLSWPFFLPIWEIGSFGAITRFESLIPNRKTPSRISRLDGHPRDFSRTKQSSINTIQIIEWYIDTHIHTRAYTRTHTRTGMKRDHFRENVHGFQ